MPAVVERRELVDAGVQQEALEAEDARVVQRAQRTEVAGHRTAPEPDVDVAPALGSSTLGRQGVDVDGRRDAVERHVDDRGDTAGSRRPGRRREALPLGAAGLVDVHVGVDHAGQQHLVGAELDHPVGSDVVVVRGDRRDPAVLHGDAGSHLATAAGEHRPRGPDHQVEGGHPGPQDARPASTDSVFRSTAAEASTSSSSSAPQSTPRTRTAASALAVAGSSSTLPPTWAT